jgi:hypothetical protein
MRGQGIEEKRSVRLRLGARSSSRAGERRLSDAQHLEIVARRVCRLVVDKLVAHRGGRPSDRVGATADSLPLDALATARRNATADDRTTPTRSAESLI